MMDDLTYWTTKPERMFLISTIIDGLIERGKIVILHLHVLVHMTREDTRINQLLPSQGNTSP